MGGVGHRLWPLDRFSLELVYGISWVGSEVGQDLEEEFTPLPQAHILFNTARSRIQTVKIYFCL